MAQQKVFVAGIEGSGRTKKEARQAAEDRIYEMLHGRDCTLAVIVFRGHVAIVYRDTLAECWISQVFDNEAIAVAPAVSGGRLKVGGSHLHGNQAIDKVIDGIRLDLAQRTWDGKETASPLLENSPRLQADFTRWAYWQLDYRRAAAAGLDDTRARQYCDWSQYAARDGALTVEAWQAAGSPSVWG